jgi:hypothetical protein
MDRANPPTPGWDDTDTLAAVRPEVRKILEAAPVFAQLAPEEKRQIASSMVKVASYLVNPDGVVTEPRRATDSAPVLAAPASLAQREAVPPLARSQADGVEATRSRLGEKQGFAGEDFQAGAVKQGVKQFGELVKKVDFPKFVSGLIQNVFQAIVDSSIQQMRAYADLLSNVAKTVDQFAQDNITPNNARDWLAERFPNELSVETSEMSGGFAEGEPVPPPQVHLAVRSEDVGAAMRTINETLNLTKPISDLTNETEELRLVQEARLQMARSRQQMLASMVILGINRIVVTDGLIHAKVVFDLRASDVAKRQARASMMDEQTNKASTHMEASYGSWFSPVSASMSADASTEHVATVESSVDETSESKAEVKAKLTGEVRVNFKSDYFPMEKLANPQMIAAIQGNAVPPEAPPAGRAA